MPALPKDEALARLTQAIKSGLGADEVREIHAELFPLIASTDPMAPHDTSPLVTRLVQHVNGGRATEEIVELWGLIFPRHRDIWYNEEDDRLYYNESAEVATAE